MMLARYLRWQKAARRCPRTRTPQQQNNEEHSMPMTWKEEIVAAFEALGGVASYTQLYQYIEDNTSRKLTSQWKATVRREIENHSKDSDNYINNKPDLFGSAKGIGKGVWMLRQMEPTTPKSPDLAEPNLPQRARLETSRVIRDTRLVRQLKQLYNNKCQVCDLAIHLKTQHYSEGHHLKPLGQPHNGPDVAGNILVLCPNHHVEFDYGIIAVDPINLFVLHRDEKNAYHGKNLTVLAVHNLDKQYLQYHFQSIFTPNP